MLTRKNIDKIKKYIGWENKPDGAVEALVEIVAKAVVASAKEHREAKLAANAHLYQGRAI
jgi:hypothetical protein